VFIRYILIVLFTFITTACVTAPQPAAPLEMPLKPQLKSQSFQVSYETEHASPKVKSVQLPAHKITRNQTVRVVADKASVTDTLFKQITDALTTMSLRVVEQGDSDYTLAIHQLELNFIEDTKYQVQPPVKPYALFDEIAKLYPIQQCATINGEVSMRLIHRASGDVVWFGKSSIDSASFHREPLIFSFSEEQVISNELEVATFVHQQNTEQARLARASQDVNIPSYKTISKMTSLTKLQGPCNRTEVSALTPMMHYYLSSILIDKIKVH
jgi:PBP1b-binding outer membrane lipoprotein LpoB